MKKVISSTISFIKRHIIKLAIALVVLGIAGGYAYSTGKLSFGQQVAYKTINPEIKDISETLSVTGQVDADEKATLRFQASGLLTWVGVKEGDLVKKNQTIAALDKRQLQKDLQKQMESYKKERWDFDQMQDDYKAKRDALVLTDEMKRILDKQQFDLNSSVIDVELRDLALKFATLTTPIAGIITRADAKYSGVNVTPAQAEFEVVNPSSVFFSGEVDETDLSMVKPGQLAKVALDAYPEESYDTQIDFVGFSPVSGATGTVYQVKLRLPDNTDNRFRLGLNGDADIILQTRSGAITVPEKVVTESSGKTTVKVLVNNQPKEVEIKTGITSPDGDIEVLEGLSVSDQVIVPNGKK